MINLGRRKFLTIGAGALAARATAAESGGGAGAGLALGFDHYAIRAMDWGPAALVGFAEKLEVDTLFITDLDVFESLEADALATVRRLAEEKQLRLLLGTWSICPSSVTFKNRWGTADEHLQLGIRAAKSLGSPVLRVVLGSARDRLTDGGIEARIEDTVKVLRRNKQQAVDAGVKIAVENHAGDMHSLELKSLVEAAGRDFVGVNLDAGNALWSLETPLENLENLGEYVLTTSLRDSAVWETEKGIAVQWTAMGEGMVDWKTYFARFAELCPEVAVNIETISGVSREFQVDTPEFMKAWPKGLPASYEKLRSWAKTGKPQQPAKPRPGQDKKKSDQEYQLSEIERSIAYCKSIGLGRKA
ncbi:sugar phosphate isomerase/epimerase family protein [Haloferula chungangensis]|uniref:Sugar phosphate isomerase/epimerase family protein n=1 Tax=Haloferula chungangensis TaxID=1048331 RepID=A0ABW2LCD3_9BACT